MGFFDFLKRDKLCSAPDKSRIYAVSEAEEVLRDLLRARSFDLTRPDARLAWETFKEFSQYKIQCDDDALLWEVGTFYTRDSDTKSFMWHMVRQFTTDPGEDDDMKQLCFDIIFHTEEPRTLEHCLWSYDFDGAFQPLFAAVECSPAYLIPLEHDRAALVDIWLDNV